MYMLKKITHMSIFTHIIFLFLLSNLWANQSSHISQAGHATVILNIEPESLSTSCAIESYIPIGLSPYNMNNQGVWLKNKRRLRWGAFIDGQSKTLSYQLVGMPSAYTYDVIHEISMDGQTSGIPGSQGILISSAFETCTRSIQTQNSKTSVEIRMTHNRTHAAFAVIEFIPQDLTPENMNENAQWFPETREIRWGPFLDQSSKTLSYDLVGPANTYSLNGLVSIDGHAESISGNSDLELLLCPLSIEMSPQSTGEYHLKLMAVCDDYSHEITEDVSFLAHDPSLVDIQGNHLTALENSRVTLTVMHQNQIIEKMFWVKAHFDMMEMERNDTMGDASDLSEMHFMEGEMLVDDKDYFQLNLDVNAIIELTFLSSSPTADVQVELLDDTTQVLLSGISMDGQNITFFPALDKGVYYIKLTSAGDIDQHKGYDLIYQIIHILPENGVIHMSPGETYQSQIYHSSHTQVFTFDLYKTVARIHFDSGSSIAGYEISVMDSDDQILQQTTVEPSGTVSLDPIEIAGSYMFKVRHHSGQIDAIHPFRVYLEALDYMAEVEPNDDFWQPTPILSGEKIKGQKNGDNDVDIYEFVLDVDAPVQLKIEGAERDVYPEIYYSTEQNHLYTLETFTGYLTHNDYWRQGTWYVKIATNQVYYISITEHALHQINAMESDNKFITANEINGITEIYGAVAANADIDYFKYHSESSGALEINFNNATELLTISIFKDGPAQNILSKDVYQNGRIFIPLGLTYGDYYIQISYKKSLEYSAEIPYQLNVYPTDKSYEIEPNDTWQQSNKLITDEPINGQLSTAMDVDIFYVDVLSTQYFILTCESASGNHPIQMQLIRTLDMFIILDIPVLDNQPLQLPMGLVTGRYYIVLATTVENQAYELKLASTENMYEILPNNSFETASPMLSETVIGGTVLMNQKDFYSFDVPVPMFIAIDFQSQGEKVVSIFHNDNIHCIDEMNIQADSQKTISLGLGKGVYYMQVSSPSGTSIPDPYCFTQYTISDTHLEIESNNTPRVATPISKDNWKQGRLYSSDDKDWYGFALPETTRFYVDFSSDASDGDYDISIVDIQNARLVSKYSINVQATLPAWQHPGIYYILVESGENNTPENYYTLNIRADADINPYAEIDGKISLVGLSLSAGKEQIAIGENVSLTVHAHYSDASVQVVEGTRVFILPSQDTQPVVSLENNYTIKGLSNGYASIVVSYMGLAGRLTLIVGQPGDNMPIFNHHGNLILVAGGGLNTNNILKEPTQYLSNIVYQRFNNRFFSHDDIYYFNPKTWHDIDGDGIKDNVVDEENITLTAFQNSISNWAVFQESDGPLYVYLIDHGGIDIFNLYPNVNLKASDLDDYLDIFQQKTGRAVVVIIEACKSGSFVDDLMTDAHHRMVITSTDHNDGYMHLNGSISFTQFFADCLYEGNSFRSAFDKARKKLQLSGLPYSAMHPQLSESTIDMANTVIVGGPFAVSSLSPQIVDQSNGDRIPLNASKELFVELSDMFGIKSVTAVILPPDYEIPETGDNFDVPIVNQPGLTLTDEDFDGKYTGTFTHFDQPGRYAILFYAQNINDYVSVSLPTMIIVGDTSSLPGDFNWDGQRDLKDMIMGLQMLSGISTGLYPQVEGVRLSDVLGLFTR